VSGVFYGAGSLGRGGWSHGPLRVGWTVWRCDRLPPISAHAHDCLQTRPTTARFEEGECTFGSLLEGPAKDESPPWETGSAATTAGRGEQLPAPQCNNHRPCRNDGSVMRPDQMQRLLDTKSCMVLTFCGNSLPE
jgi:hypothetical protein